MTPQPEFVTERLLLRPLEVQHAEALLRIFSFDEVRKQFLTTTFSTINETTKWIEAVSDRPNSSIFCISLQRSKSLPASNDPEMIGLIGLNSFDRLLYMFHPDLWGTGYCTEALRWFLTQLFEGQPERGVLVAGAHHGNERSLRVLLKCGFVRADSLESAMGGLHKRGGNANSEGEDVDSCESEPAANSHSDFTWFWFERPLVMEE